ncbi:unnamed protein product [Linum grandiflorum]
MVACGADGPTLEQLLSSLGAQDIEDLNSKASATMEALHLAAPGENNSPESNRAIVARANAVWADRKYSLSKSFNGNDKVTVPFMNKFKLDLHYANFEDFKVLELPYQSGDDGKHPQFSMYIFLPHKRGGLPRMLREHFGGSNPGEAFSQTLGGLEKQYMGKVHIPKWKFSLGCHLKETMEKLGLTLPFEFAEDFDKMFNERKMEPTAVSDVIQSAFIQVDEKGTVAAAVTVSRVVMMECKKPIRKPVDDFIADHPFMFLIVEKRSKAIIFAGSVVNPLQQ